MVDFQKTIPILRIFDVAKAKDFYIGFLGFAVDWENLNRLTQVADNTSHLKNWLVAVLPPDVTNHKS